MAHFLAVRVYLGSDHAGFELKNHLVSHLGKQGHEVTDIGPRVYDAADDYPAFCVETALRVVADEGSLGLVIGGSGNGEQIAANKVPGARAALAWKPEIARLAREHNHAQLLGIGARMHTVEEAVEIVEAFLTTEPSPEERHQRRIDQLLEYERTGTPPPLPA
jgi:ribose 5-phosphate isomerase B